MASVRSDPLELIERLGDFEKRKAVFDQICHQIAASELFVEQFGEYNIASADANVFSGTFPEMRTGVVIAYRDHFQQPLEFAVDPWHGSDLDGVIIFSNCYALSKSASNRIRLHRLEYVMFSRQHLRGMVTG